MNMGTRFGIKELSRANGKYNGRTKPRLGKAKITSAIRDKLDVFEAITETRLDRVATLVVRQYALSDIAEAIGMPERVVRYYIEVIKKRNNTLLQMNGVSDLVNEFISLSKMAIGFSLSDHAEVSERFRQNPEAYGRYRMQLRQESVTYSHNLIALLQTLGVAPVKPQQVNIRGEHKVTTHKGVDAEQVDKMPEEKFMQLYRDALSEKVAGLRDAVEGVDFTVEKGDK